MSADATVKTAPTPRGAVVDVCDVNHQAIAFVGTCPLCRRKFWNDPPVAEGAGIYAADLRRLIKAQVERL